MLVFCTLLSSSLPASSFFNPPLLFPCQKYFIFASCSLLVYTNDFLLLSCLFFSIHLYYFSSTLLGLIISNALISLFKFLFFRKRRHVMTAASTMQGWRLPIRPHAASNLRCGGIHISYVAPLWCPPSLYHCSQPACLVVLCYY